MDDRRERNSAIADIEDVYPLSPWQDVLLRHTVRAPRAGAGVQHGCWLVEGAFDIDTFERAWRTVIDRHPALRTGFVWEGVTTPVQAVRGWVSWRIGVQDWRELSAEQQEEALHCYLEADATQRFDLVNPPLMRIAIFQTAPHLRWIVWTFHHLVLDGWSCPIVLREVFQVYRALESGSAVELPPVHPYRDHIAWLSRQDLPAAEAFWRKALDGFRVPTLVSTKTREQDDDRPTRWDTIELVPRDIDAIRALARRAHLTLSTVFHGLWAIVLATWSGRRDIVFGSTVAGRPAAVPGVESIVGHLATTLPARIVLPDAQASAISYLQSAQGDQAAAREFHYADLGMIHSCSDVPVDQPLYDSVLVFENYPVGLSLSEALRGIGAGLARHTFVERSLAPLTVMTLPGKEMTVLFLYQTHRLDRGIVEGLAERFAALLGTVVARPDAEVGELLDVG